MSVIDIIIIIFMVIIFVSTPWAVVFYLWYTEQKESFHKIEDIKVEEEEWVWPE